MQATGKQSTKKVSASQLEAEEVEVEKRLKLKKNQRRSRKAFYSGIEIKGNLNSERNSSKLKVLKFLKKMPTYVLEGFDKVNIV
eukprot:snap_masked-scaffold_76-processed-gene-0.17-mRNA-1 protein AED:1.00 eAED:1.00 QI:0/-1/0/0/-1/1/1/0/83